jgi:cytochrome c6
MKLQFIALFLPFVFTLFGYTVTEKQTGFCAPPVYENTDSINLELGKKIYRQKCRFCHGKTGSRKTKRIPALRDSKLNLKQLTQVISHGRNNMAAYKNKLSKNEILSVAAYVQTFKQKAD